MKYKKLVSAIKQSLFYLAIFWPLYIMAQSVEKNSTTEINFKNLHTVLLVIAMQSEADSIIQALNLREVAPFKGLPMRGYAGKYATLNIGMVVNGKDARYGVENIARQPAILSTYLGIQRFNPDLIISIGTAGGIQANKSKLREIFISKRINFFDRRIDEPSYREYGLGNYTSPALSPKILTKAQLKEGIVCSGDSFDINDTDYKLMLKLGCNAIDMEAAGVAWVSQLSNIPIIAIKGITNFSQDRNGFAEFKQNINSVVSALTSTLQNLLAQLAVA